jgi:hypothetical protein
MYGFVKAILMRAVSSAGLVRAFVIALYQSGALSSLIN